MSVLIVIGIVATAALSCVFDTRARRIPNALTIGSACAGWCIQAVVAGGHGLAVGVAGWLTGLLLFLPWFLFGGMGGGDVKLLAAFGVWLGPVTTVWAALYAMVAGGVVAAWTLAAGRLARGGAGRSSSDGPQAIAYALPVTIGVGLALWLA